MRTVYLETTVIGHIAGRLHPAADAAKWLAAQLIATHAVPASEPRDALHIALAATNGIEFLVTWNFKHIMNPATQHLIEYVCQEAGIVSSVICTPEQLLVTYEDP